MRISKACFETESHDGAGQERADAPELERVLLAGASDGMYGA
ncbi:hypothetical protein ACFU5O_10935 [Streptomyces sp. NPDC057445]